MTKSSVLALDLATVTGWAWHSVGMPRPFFGTIALPGSPGEVGRPVSYLRNALERFAADVATQGAPLTQIFFEAQHVATQINIDTVYRLISLGGVAEMVAWELNPRSLVWKVEKQTWRKHFIGRGSGFKRERKGGPYLPGEDPKQLCMEHVERYGWHPDSLDAAEAVGILDYALSCIGEEVHPRPWRDQLILNKMERSR